MKSIEKRAMIFISCMIALMILLQHHYVSMQFDDYGYASLSYAGFENHVGMSYGLAEILRFLKAHYFNWGGRVVYFFFEIGIFRLGGLPLMQTVQAVIIILIGVVSGKIVALATEADSYKCIALTMVLYGTFHLNTLRDGVYWYSASVLYVWPMLPFLGSVYLYLCNEKRERAVGKAVCILLAFLAACSQEQIAVLVTVTYILIILFCRFGKKKKAPGYLFGMGISAIAGSIFTVFAPGNMVRASSGIYEEFYNKGFLPRIINNIGYIINDNTGRYNCVFVFFMTVFCGTAIALCLKSRIIAVMTVVFSVCLVIEMFLPVSKEMGVIAGGLWLLIFIPLLMFYYLKRDSYLFLSLLAAGACTQIMMVASPAIPLRLHTMFEFILHIIVAENVVYVYRNGKENKKIQAVLKIGVVVMTLYAVCNMAFVIEDYRNNYKVNQRNHYELIEAAEEYKNKGEVETVVLCKLKSDAFAQMMPYQEGYGFIEVWMKNYYELPAETVFEWK